jgi:hypothetical protein
MIKKVAKKVAKKVTKKPVAQATLDIIQERLSDLERGGANWNPAVIQRIWEFCNQLQSRLEKFERTNVKHIPAESTNKEAYCVIGDKVTFQHGVHRVWKRTAEEAAQHAARLMQNNPYNQKPTDKLFVVKVVAVVHRKQPVSHVDVHALDAETQMRLFA